MQEISVLLICGSLRKPSMNRKLLSEALRLLGPADGTFADIRFPLYDGDIETSEGIPDAVGTLAEQIEKADAIIIGCPEYNASFSGVLKNALDWVSRLKGNPWLGKPVAIVSAAGGRAGGARSQSAFRLAMNPFRARVLPGPEVLVASAGQAFDDEGRLKDERYIKALETLMSDLRGAAGR